MDDNELTVLFNGLYHAQRKLEDARKRVAELQDRLCATSLYGALDCVRTQVSIDLEEALDALETAEKGYENMRRAVETRHAEIFA